MTWGGGGCGWIPCSKASDRFELACCPGSYYRWCVLTASERLNRAGFYHSSRPRNKFPSFDAALPTLKNIWLVLRKGKAALKALECIFQLVITWLKRTGITAPQGERLGVWDVGSYQPAWDGEWKERLYQPTTEAMLKNTLRRDKFCRTKDS